MSVLELFSATPASLSAPDQVTMIGFPVTYTPCHPGSLSAFRSGDVRPAGRYGSEAGTGSTLANVIACPERGSPSCPASTPSLPASAQMCGAIKSPDSNMQITLIIYGHVSTYARATRWVVVFMISAVLAGKSMGSRGEGSSVESPGLIVKHQEGQGRGCGKEQRERQQWLGAGCRGWRAGIGSWIQSVPTPPAQPPSCLLGEVESKP